MQSLGFNYRLTDFQAALGISQLRKADQFLERRSELATRYDQAFASLEGIRLPQKSGRARSAHHLYVLRIQFSKTHTRARLMRELKKRDIGTQVHYLPVYRHPYYQMLGYQISNCPETDTYYREALSLPMYQNLSDEDQDYVIATLKELLG
jgi:dTDP-4-amino-4,6-dideoxygalactose transaminase